MKNELHPPASGVLYTRFFSCRRLHKNIHHSESEGFDLSTFPPGLHQVGRPFSPPPRTEPEYCPSLRATGPTFIRAHLHYYTYVWMVSGESFWLYPISTTDGDILGYAWDGAVWVPVMINIAQIDSLF